MWTEIVKNFAQEGKGKCDLWMVVLKEWIKP